MVKYTQYTWIFVISTIGAFVAAFGIGANDLANSFGSSVGAKALTMPQAVIIAGIMEFLGALLLGASVTDTVRSKVSRVSVFQPTPDLFMYGMMSAILTAGFWDNFACHLQLPVSTTHTVVGAIVGMSMAIKGGGAVVWSAEQDPFPYLQGMSVIFLSWACSPIVSGVISALLFFLTRTFVLRSKHSFKRALIVLPFLVGGTFWLITSFVIQTGNKNHTWNTTQSDSRVAWIGAVVGAGFGLITLLIIGPLIRRRILRDEEEAAEKMSNALEAGTKDSPPSSVEEGVAKGDQKLDVDGKLAGSTAPPDVSAKQAAHDGVGRNAGVPRLLPGPLGKPFEILDKQWGRVKATRWAQWIGGTRVFRILTFGLNYKIHDDIPKSEIVTGIWERAEVFDFNTEMVFRYLQVFTAAVMSFAHGSNDVANAMGPYSAVWNVWQTSTVPTKANVPTWILAYGGAGITIGLAVYGWQIMRVFGVKSVKLTNSRGFCLELATAITVILSSRYGLPVSTTQCLTGALLAIGLLEGPKGVNWLMFLRIFGGWGITLVLAGLLSAAIAAWGVYSPNKQYSDAAVFTAAVLQPQMLQMNREMFATAAATNNVAFQQQVQSFNASLTQLYKSPVKYPQNIVGLQSQIFPVFNLTECLNPAFGLQVFSRAAD